MAVERVFYVTMYQAGLWGGECLPLCGETDNTQGRFKSGACHGGRGGGSTKVICWGAPGWWPQGTVFQRKGHPDWDLMMTRSQLAEEGAADVGFHWGHAWRVEG